jgi:phage-related protein
VLQTLNISQGIAITTGFSFSLGFPFGYGAPVDPNQTNVFNSGNRPAPAVITIPGPVTDPIIYNDTTSQELAFQIDVASGDSLTIDLAYRTVKLNGTASRCAALLAPDWFMLESGDNYMRYRASTGGGSPATIAFRNAWR